mmetsp:Transcript_23528/g.71999  ORF Transcript_23528/g.71999 Transcript_23528/m.71999 type:complete len:240 (+) Transcript_23528:2895-3614(+)
MMMLRSDGSSSLRTGGGACLSPQGGCSSSHTISPNHDDACSILSRAGSVPVSSRQTLPHRRTTALPGRRSRASFVPAITGAIVTVDEAGIKVVECAWSSSSEAAARPPAAVTISPLQFRATRAPCLTTTDISPPAVCALVSPSRSSSASSPSLEQSCETEEVSAAPPQRIRASQVSCTMRAKRGSCSRSASEAHTWPPASPFSSEKGCAPNCQPSAAGHSASRLKAAVPDSQPSLAAAP